MAFEGFQLSQIALGEVSLRVRGASGPPPLLLCTAIQRPTPCGREAVYCGHVIPEEKPAETLALLRAFFAGTPSPNG